MTGSQKLTSDSIEAMAELHAEAFSSSETWTASAFADLFNLTTTHAEGIEHQGRLQTLIVAQFSMGEAEILTLATTPGARRRGLAGKTLDRMEHRLRALGLTKWLLDVAADNHSAMAFYAKHGFQIDGRRRNYYKRLAGQRVDAMLMSKPVGGQVPK